MLSRQCLVKSINLYGRCFRIDSGKPKSFHSKLALGQHRPYSKTPAEYKTPNMNELPTPRSSWKSGYNAQQAKYNRQLIASLAFFSGTMVYVYMSGAVELNLAPKMKNPDSDKKQKTKSATAKDTLKLPNSVPYLLIGAGTASFAAFRAIRSQDPRAKILVIGEEEHFPYMRPPLSKELWFMNDPDISRKLSFKQWNGKERSIFFEHSDFYCSPSELDSRENGGVAILTGHRVVKVDADTQQVYLEDGTRLDYV